jgi:hypothetical protein
LKLRAEEILQQVLRASSFQMEGSVGYTVRFKDLMLSAGVKHESFHVVAPTAGIFF